MMIFLLLIAVFLVVKGVISKIGNSIVSNDGVNDYKNDEPTIVIHNHIQETHLHISKEDLKTLTDLKSNK